MSTSNFRLLKERGSSWLRSKVLFADHRVIVLNKPPNLVCQLHRPTRDRDAEVCLQVQLRTYITDSGTMLLYDRNRDLSMVSMRFFMVITFPCLRISSLDH